jgi:periplasmic protein TonB
MVSLEKMEAIRDRRRTILWSVSFLLAFTAHVMAFVGLPERLAPLSASAVPVPVLVVAFAPAAPKPIAVEPIPEEPEPDIKAVEVPEAEPFVKKAIERSKKVKPKRVERRSDPVPHLREEAVAALTPVAAPPAPVAKAAPVEADFMPGRGSVPPDYQAILSAWLEKHKQYPRRARLRRQEGVVQLSFTLDRSGHVLSYGITRSSGYSLLDEEVASLIQRAQPMPPFPSDMKEANLKLTVPISFRLL